MSKWKMVRLGEVCKILDNMRVPVTASKRKKGIYPYYGANGIQDRVDDYIFDDDLVLLAEDGGNFGSKNKPIAYRVSGKCWVNNHAHVLKPKENVNIDYLCYSIMFYDVTSLINGTTRAKLNQAAVHKMTIPLPPLLIQGKIVTILGRINNLIEKRREQIKKLDLLVKSRFVEMFSDETKWQLSVLGDICEMKSGKFISASEIKAELIEGLFPCYGGNGLRGYVENYSHNGDFPLIGRQGALCGNVQYAQGKFYATEHAVVTWPKIELDTQWLCYKLRDLNLNKFAIGAAQPGLTIEKLNGIKISLPPLSLQKEFASFVQQVDKSKFVMQKGLEKLELGYKALMQQYFD